MSSRLSIFMVLLFTWCHASAQLNDTKYQINCSYDRSNERLILEIPNANDSVQVEINEKWQSLFFVEGKSVLAVETSRAGQLLTIKTEQSRLKLYHLSKTSKGHIRLIHIPLWLSIFPPLIAIALALLFKEVIIPLFAGIWSGAFIAGGMRIESPFYFFQSFVEVVAKYIINALNDTGHLSVIVFSLLIGGMVAVISRNGGMAGVVKSLTRFATSPKRAQFITWLLGVAIFFDDYANTLVVGNTMRSVTDRFKVSREKLAYIVDSTAAPVAAVAFITTWIGAELGYIDGGLRQIENFGHDLSPYAIFVSSLKYSFYPFLTLCFMLFIIFRGRDFGPMYRAEVRARKTGQVSSAATPEEDEPNMEDLSPVAGAPLSWQDAFFPVLTVIAVTILGLVSTGMDVLYEELINTNVVLANNWSEIWINLNLLTGEDKITFLRKVGILIGSSDSYVALLWASLCGATLAVAITLVKKTMKVIDAMHTLVTGFKSMMPALIILALAWALALTTEELHTATFLSSTLEGSINPYLLPGLIFVLAGFIAFSTGSSWSTMAILYPIAIPTSWAVSHAAGLDDALSLEILLNVIATVLGASVLGDHCSPISDTTILSSLASDCNHIQHVRTQMPYALTVGLMSLTCCVLSTYFGGGWLVSTILILMSLVLLLLLVEKKGKLVDQPAGD